MKAGPTLGERINVKQSFRADSLKRWQEKQAGKLFGQDWSRAGVKPMRQTSLVTFCSRLNTAWHCPKDPSLPNYHLKAGTGEPWAGQASPIGWLADRAILDPSFSNENFGIVPPTGSMEKELSLNIFITRWAGLGCSYAVEIKKNI